MSIVPVEVGGEVYGFDVSDVHEILPCPEVTPVPFAPPWVTGLADVRGEIVTVVSLLQRVKGKGFSSLPELGSHLILLDGPDRTAFGILVDRVGSVMVVRENQVAPGQSSWERGRMTLKEGMLGIINPLALIGKVTTQVV